MIITHHHLSPILVATALVLVGSVRLARAQDRELLDEIDQVVPPIRIVMDQTQVELRVFGQDGGVNAARKRVEANLERRVQRLVQSYQLTEPQKKKLLVAGRGDIKRFFDSLQEARAKFPLVDIDQDTVVEFRREIQRLGRIYRSDLFSRGSIFAKTLSKTLNDEQATRFKKEVGERKQRQFRATMTWVTGTLEQTLRMTADQRQRLEKVLIEETRAPEAFGDNDYYGLIFQAAKIPEAKLKPIFDDDQWLEMTRQFQQVMKMERVLKASGFLPVDGAAAEGPAADDGEALEGLRFFPPIRRR